MHPANLHGVGVITKLYFDIFPAFKESKVIQLSSLQGHRFGYQSKARMHIPILLAVNSNLEPILHRSDTAA